MRNNLNNIIKFYKDYYKDLDIETINSEYFILMLEFDILIRFNIRLTLIDIMLIIESIKR